MSIDTNAVIAIATCVYGAATFFLVIQVWRDRVQRDRHFKIEEGRRSLNALRSAFYEASGYWEARHGSSLTAPIDASQLGRILEALIRLECELRLNGYAAEANHIGLARTGNFHKVGDQLDRAGIALGLLPEGHSAPPSPRRD